MHALTKRTIKSIQGLPLAELTRRIRGAVHACADATVEASVLVASACGTECPTSTPLCSVSGASYKAFGGNLR
jgi:hypothetical protein